jgi:hypothetical protein
MLKISLFIIVLLAGVIACSSAQDGFKSTGVITGYDLRECPCCGGYFIEIDSTKYRFDQLPDSTDFNIPNNPEFPIYVSLDWHPDSSACMRDEIIVTAIKAKSE